MNRGRSGLVHPDARLYGAIGAVIATVGLAVWGLTGSPGHPSVAKTSASIGASARAFRGPFRESSGSLTSAVPGLLAQSTAAAKQGYRLKFDPGFPGNRINTNIWNTCYPHENPNVGCQNFGENQAEYQWYLSSQVIVGGGVVRLVAKKARTLGHTRQGKPKYFGCRSGMITTYPSFDFKYGIVQVVAQMHGAKGMWPALWLQATKGWPPEVDILERWFDLSGRSATEYNHYKVPGQTRPKRTAAYPVTANLSVGWHTYTLVWSPSELAWYIDGRVTLTTTQHIPHQKMYFIADLADSLKVVPGECKGALDLRSVKIWQTQS
jgi:beta-glucanase (GH16 family)